MQDRDTRGWAVDPQGLNTAGWGLFLTPSDMAKVGQLYLNGGTWDGGRIVSPGWIEESTREHCRCAQWGNLAYGYLWWLPDGESYAALGDGGKAIYASASKGLVVSIAALFKPEAKDSVELVKRYIEPAFADWGRARREIASGGRRFKEAPSARIRTPLLSVRS